jgi:hypothetical protein
MTVDYEILLHVVSTSSIISDRWILEHVTPNMVCCGIACKACLMLGHAMLWRIFDSSGELLVPEDQTQHILDRYLDIRHKSIADGSNPIKKVPLIVDGFDAKVLMETVEGGDLQLVYQEWGCGGRRFVYLHHGCTIYVLRTLK